MALRQTILAATVVSSLALGASPAHANENYSDADFSDFYGFFFEFLPRVGRAISSAGAYYIIVEPVTTAYGTEKEAHEEYVVKPTEAIFDTNDR